MHKSKAAISVIYDDEIKSEEDEKIVPILTENDCSSISERQVFVDDISSLDSSTSIGSTRRKLVPSPIRHHLRRQLPAQYDDDTTDSDWPPMKKPLPRYTLSYPQFANQLMCQYCCKLLCVDDLSSIRQHIAAHRIELNRFRICCPIACPYCSAPIRGTRKSPVAWPSTTGFSSFVEHLESQHQHQLVADQHDQTSAFFINHDELASRGLQSVPFANLINCRYCGVTLYGRSPESFIVDHICNRISQQSDQLIPNQLESSLVCPTCCTSSDAVYRTSVDVLLHILDKHRSTPAIFASVCVSAARIIQRQFHALLIQMFGKADASRIRRNIFPDANRLAITDDFDPKAGLP